MNERLVRYADLTPFAIEYGGAVDVIENEYFMIHQGAAATIHAVRGVGGWVRAPYVHDGAEVLFAHLGHWQVRFGPNGEDGFAKISPGGVTAVPPHTFRRIDKIDEGAGFLLILRSSSELCTLPESDTVFSSVAATKLARGTGHYWIDASSGTPRLRESIWRDGQPPWAHGAGARKSAIEHAVTVADIKPNSASLLAGRGVDESGIIAPYCTRDGFGTGAVPVRWCLGFNLRMLTLASGAYIPLHTRSEPEVLFVHDGAVEILGEEERALMMGSGDTLSVPTGLPHSFRNTTSGRTQILTLRGADDPSAPVFLSMPNHG